MSCEVVVYPISFSPSPAELLRAPRLMSYGFANVECSLAPGITSQLHGNGSNARQEQSRRTGVI